MAKSAPAVPAAVAEAFERLIPEREVGVAVSGGGDSVALLGLLRTWRPHLQIHVATVDHGLRPDSAAEAVEVGKLCETLSANHSTLGIPPLEDVGNLQARAREARYTALATWAHGISPSLPVLLGHTMNDQAETVLMRLARGSGAEGLSGMATQWEWKGTQWRRPLLGVQRQDLRDWLMARNLSWADDPSNDDPRFDRIKARKMLELLGPLGVSIEGLAVTADRLSRQCRVLEADAERLKRGAVCAKDGLVKIDRLKMRDAIADTGMRVLAEQLREIGGNSYRPRFRSLEPLFDRAISDENFVATLAGCLVSADPAAITIRREPASENRRGNASRGRNSDST